MNAHKLMGESPRGKRRYRRVWVWIAALWLAVGMSGGARPALADDASPRVWLAAIARSGPTTGATSRELIDDALARQEIDAETALVYHMYAMFGDPRLPALYRGVGDELDTIQLQRTAGQFAELSAASQALLAPFFQPPVYADSWYGQQVAARGQTQVGAHSVTDDACDFDPGPSPIPPGGWGCLDGGLGANFRIWWDLEQPAHKARAEFIAHALQTEIWPKLTILMRRDPPDDSGPHVFTGRDGSEYIWGDGGGGRLDIYLIQPPAGTGGAATIAYPPGCDLRPSFILVSPTLDNATLLPGLTHEFFHTFQFGTSQGGQCDEWEWWSEATANWAIDFVYPQDNWEHQWAFYYLQRQNTAISIFDGQAGGRNSYLLPLFLTKHLNDPGVIRRSWENAATFSANSLAGINQAAGGQLTDLWHEFVKTLPNEAPYDRCASWDNLTYPVLGEPVKANEASVEIVGRTPDGYDIRKIFDPVELSGAPDTRYDMPSAIPPLASRTFRYRFQDSNARAVAFTNPLLFGPLPEGAKILALYKIEGGAWQQEDWTTQSVKTFCREIPDQRLDELILTISNGQWANRALQLDLAPAPLLGVTNIGCARWEGTFESEIHVTTGGTDYTDTYRGTLVFELRTDLPVDFLNPTYANFVVTAGSVTWEHRGKLNDCDVNGGPTTYSAADLFDGNLEVASYGVDKDGDYRIHTGVVALEAEGTALVKCPDTSFTVPVGHGAIAILGQGTKPISADGLTLQGRHAESSPVSSSVTVWNFKSKPK